MSKQGRFPLFKLKRFTIDVNNFFSSHTRQFQIHFQNMLQEHLAVPRTSSANTDLVSPYEQFRIILSSVFELLLTHD